MTTRFFSRMFDAVQAGEDELIKQVQKDLETAKKTPVNTDQLDYVPSKEGTITVVDKGTDEKTEVSPTEDGYLMNSGDQSFLIPKLKEQVEEVSNKLNKVIDALEPKKETSLPEGVEAPNSAKENEEKEKPTEERKESAAHPDKKVVISIDGKLVTAYILEEQYEGKLKVKIPSLDNQVVTIDKSSVQSESETKPIKKFTSKQYKTFSEASYCIVTDLGNSKLEAYAVLDNLFTYDASIRKVKGGFKSLQEAQKYINDNPKEIRAELLKIEKANKNSDKKFSLGIKLK